jgi:predicted transcriptional regulator
MYMVVRDLMTNSPAKIHFEQSIDEAIKVMMAHCVPELFVVDSGNFLRGAVPEVEILKAELNGVDGNASIDTITSRSIATVTPDEPVTALFPRFRTGYCRQLAVTENGKLIGQIQRRDVIRLMHTLRRLDLSVSDISGSDISGSDISNSECSMPLEDSVNQQKAPMKNNAVPNPNFVKKMKDQTKSNLFSDMK